MRRTALFLLLPFFGALPAVAQSVPAYAIPNSKHYRESGVGNAHGRTGSAQLTARALLGKDGNTTVELTTGALDSTTTPPGSFAKVQLKPLGPDGDAMFAQNFNTLSTGNGYYSFNWPSLYRHQQAQIQANITGIDNRTDVVTVVDTVKLRPDIAIQNFHVPESAFVNVPVTIPANVVELNGDSGATANCTLAIDGNVVDKASSIYVDAAGSVTCAFSYTFTSTGTHTVQVTAANVAPADWDTGNNSGSGTINIVDINTNAAEHGSASFHDQKGGFPLSMTSSDLTWRAGVLFNTNSYATANNGEQQDANTTFSSGFGCAGETNALPYQFPVDIYYSESMDGAQVYSGKAIGITGTSSSVPVNQTLCNSNVMSYVQQMGSGIADDYVFHVISKTYYDGASKPVYTFQQVDSTRNAGDVTYFSAGYECQWWAPNCNTDPTNYHMWNSTTETVLGNLVAVGSTWVPSLTVRDATGNGFGGSISVSLFTDQQISGQPNTCIDSGPDIFGYTYHDCSSSSTNYTETTGSASY
jgi:hypothetical protein